MASATLNYSHLLPVSGVSTYRLLDPPFAIAQATPDEGHIAPVDRSGLQLLRQSSVRSIVLGNHQKSGGILVESMHDSGANDPIDTRQMVAVSKHCVDKCSCTNWTSRVDNHPRGLVYHEQVFILIKNIQRDLLWN
jgi:hypothetical protein